MALRRTTDCRGKYGETLWAEVSFCSAGIKFKATILILRPINTAIGRSMPPTSAGHHKWDVVNTSVGKKPCKFKQVPTFRLSFSCYKPGKFWSCSTVKVSLVPLAVTRFVKGIKSFSYFLVMLWLAEIHLVIWTFSLSGFLCTEAAFLSLTKKKAFEIRWNSLILMTMIILLHSGGM